jgi:hypothetical protein
MLGDIFGLFSSETFIVETRGRKRSCSTGASGAFEERAARGGHVLFNGAPGVLVVFGFAGGLGSLGGAGTGGLWRAKED